VGGPYRSAIGVPEGLSPLQGSCGSTVQGCLEAVQRPSAAASGATPRSRNLYRAPRWLLGLLDGSLVALRAGSGTVRLA